MDKFRATIVCFLGITILSWSGCVAPPPKPQAPENLDIKVPIKDLQIKLVKDNADDLTFNLYNGSNLKITSVTIEISEYDHVETAPGSGDVLWDLQNPPKVLSATTTAKKFKLSVEIPGLSAREITIPDTGTMVPQYATSTPAEGHFAGVKVFEAISFDEALYNSYLQRLGEWDRKYGERESK